MCCNNLIHAVFYSLNKLLLDGVFHEIESECELGLWLHYPLSVITWIYIYSEGSHSPRFSATDVRLLYTVLISIASLFDRHQIYVIYSFISFILQTHRRIKRQIKTMPTWKEP